ncbi:MAG: MBOAT family O-acyltransferase [Pseudomonadota bacterium]
MNLLAVDSVISLSFFLSQIVAVGVFWLAPRHLRPEALALVTFGFLALADPTSLAILVAMTMVTAYASGGGRQNQAVPTIAATALIALTLVAFKLGEARVDNGGMMMLLLPLGISFYTFRCLHVVIETHLAIQEPPTLRELVGYLFFMPTIVAGPIHRLPDYLRDRRRAGPLSSADASQGLTRIVYGYTKIVLIANFVLDLRIAPWLAERFADNPPLAAYAECLHSAFFLYLFFSGYSDIAIGFALLMGYRVIENFNNPFMKASVSGFWRSWHISLSSWIREYVFAGVLAITRRRWVGVIASMVTIGLWHQLTVNWLLWGLYHAMGLLVRNYWLAHFPADRYIRTVWHERIYNVICWFITFNFVILSFSIAKEGSPADALDTLGTILFWWF